MALAGRRRGLWFYTRGESLNNPKHASPFATWRKKTLVPFQVFSWAPLFIAAIKIITFTWTAAGS